MINIKRGSTFFLDATVTGNGAVIPGGIGAWTIRSQVRTKGGRLIDTLVAAITDAAACTYTLAESASGVTADWPVEELEMDIEYTVNGVVIHTETATVNVLKSVTQAEVV